MKKSTRITNLLTTNCTIVEAQADMYTIHKIFSHFPNRFLPVVNGLRFIGVILKEEFMQHFMYSENEILFAGELISKEMVKLSPHNTLAEAKEVFDTKVFDMIPVVDDEGDLIGILLRDDVNAAWQQMLRTSDGRRNTFHKVLTFLSL